MLCDSNPMIPRKRRNHEAEKGQWVVAGFEGRRAGGEKPRLRASGLTVPWDVAVLPGSVGRLP